MSHDLFFEQPSPSGDEGEPLTEVILVEEAETRPEPRRLDDKLAVWQRDLDLAEADSHIAYMQTSMSVLSALGAELAAALEQRNQEYESLRTRVAGLLPDLASASLLRQESRTEGRSEPDAKILAEVVMLRSEAESAKSSLATLGAQRNELALRLQRHNAELEQLGAAVATAQSDLQTLYENKVSIEQQLSSRLNELHTARAHAAELEAELHTARANRAELETHLADRSAELGLLQHRLDTTLAELESAQLGRTELETQLAGERSNLAALAERSDFLGAQLQARDEEMLDVGARIAAIRDNLLAALGEPDSISGSEGETQGETEQQPASSADMDSVNSVNDVGEGVQPARLPALAALAERVNAALARLREQDEGLAAAQSAIAARQEEVASLGAIRSTLEESLKQRDLDLETAVSNAQGLQTEFEGVLSERLALAERVHFFESEQAGFLAQLEALRGELQAAISERETISSQFRTGRQELADFRKRVEQLKSELALAAVERESLVAVNEKLAQANAWSERLPGLAEFVTSFSNQPPMKTLAAELAVRTGTFPTVTEQPQDLLEIDGITSVFERRLYREGIGTYWELAHLPDEDLTRILKLSDEQLAGLDLAAIRASARQKAEDMDSVGRLWSAVKADDLARLGGVNTVYQQKLYKAGICSYEALAKATPEQLAEIIRARKLEASDYQSWIDQAREVYAQRAQS